MTGTCALCLSRNVNLTSEHIFPASIGGALEVPALCAECNSFLGSKVDVLLTDDPLIAMIRSGLAIAAKSGVIPAPLHRGEMLGHSGVLGSVHVRSDGSHAVKPEFTQETILTNDGRTEIRVLGSPSDVAAALEKMSSRARRDGRQLVIREQFEQRIVKPVVRSHWRSDASHLIRPLLKIAYELALGWLGSTYLEDPQAESLRRSIATGALHDIDAEIGYFPQQSLFSEVALPSTDHAAALVLQDGWIKCAVRIFNVIEGMILVSERRDHYPHAPEGFLALDSMGNTVRQHLPDPDAPAAGFISWERSSTEHESFMVKTFIRGTMTYEMTLEIDKRPQ